MDEIWDIIESVSEGFPTCFSQATSLTEQNKQINK